MSEKILKKYKSLSLKKNKLLINRKVKSLSDTHKLKSSSLSFSPEILNDKNPIKYSYEDYHNFSRLIERNPQQRYLNERALSRQPVIQQSETQPDNFISSELYPNLNENTKKYIKTFFLLPDDKLNIFLQDHKKNVKVLKESSIVHSSRQKIEKLFSSERFIPPSLRQIKPLKNTFGNNKYFIIIFNNYLKIIDLCFRDYDNRYKKFIEIFKNNLIKLFETYNDKNLLINNLLDFIIDLTDLLRTEHIPYLFDFINKNPLYLIYRYEILFAINTIVAYILNYLINHLYIYNNIDFINNNDIENTLSTGNILFNITSYYNIPNINNFKVSRFFGILQELYNFQLFIDLNIQLYNLYNPISEYSKLYKFIILISLFFNYNSSTFIDELDYYKYNVNLIVDKINNPLRNQIGGKKNK